MPPPTRACVHRFGYSVGTPWVHRQAGSDRSIEPVWVGRMTVSFACWNCWLTFSEWRWWYTDSKTLTSRPVMAATTMDWMPWARNSEAALCAGRADGSSASLRRR